jgi:hypothetical protein
MVDVETNGPIPGTDDYSMVSFGAVHCGDPGKMFYSGIMIPISSKFDPGAVKVNGVSMEDSIRSGKDPRRVMAEFDAWLSQFPGKAMFISDNNGFDYMFIAWYFHHFLGKNPFGHSSTNLGSLYKGMVLNMRLNFKHLRRTRHSHHPIDDAQGNVESFQFMQEGMGLVL